MGFFNRVQFYLTNLMQISKNWKGIFCFAYKIYFLQCEQFLLLLKEMKSKLTLSYAGGGSDHPPARVYGCHFNRDEITWQET